MTRLDIYICTKSKCTAKRTRVKLWAADDEAGSYNGPDLLAAIQELVTTHVQKRTDPSLNKPDPIITALLPTLAMI
jgi:hypothetical protein